jgi:hypothetical protein
MRKGRLKMRVDIEKLSKREYALIEKADEKRGAWIVSISCGEIEYVGENFDYDVVPEYFKDWRDGRTFDNYNNEVLAHVLLYGYLQKLMDGSADKKAYISTLRGLTDRKQDLQEDIEVANKELGKIQGYIDLLESLKD